MGRVIARGRKGRLGLAAELLAQNHEVAALAKATAMGIDHHIERLQMQWHRLEFEIFQGHRETLVLAQVLHQGLAQGHAACAVLPAGAEVIHLLGQRNAMPANPLGQALEQGQHLLLAHARHEPVDLHRIDLIEARQRNGDGHAIVCSPGLESVIECKPQAALLDHGGEGLRGDAIGLMAHEVFTPEEKQLGLLTRGLSPPLPQAIEVIHRGRNPAVVEGLDQGIVDQQVLPTGPLLEPLHLVDEPTVVLEEGQLECGIALHQALTNHDEPGLACLLLAQLRPGQSTAREDGQTIEHTARIAHHAAGLFLPVRLGVRHPNERAGGGLHPLGLNGRDGAGKEATGLDLLGRHEPFGRLLGEMRARPDCKLHIVCALPQRWLGRLDAHANVGEQPGENGLVKAVVIGRHRVDSPALRQDPVGDLPMQVSPLPHSNGRQKGRAKPRLLLPIGMVVREGLIAEGPELEPGGELAARVGKLLVGGVGSGLLIERPISRVLNGQGRDQHQHLLQALPFSAGHEHAAQARVQGQARELTAHLGELALTV